VQNWFFRSLLGGIREHQGLVDPVLMKTTKAFERGLEGLEMVAPRAGLEPATSRLQVPQFFNRAWTISSPAYRKSRGGCRALLRRYWTGSAASSLCTFLPTR